MKGEGGGEEGDNKHTLLSSPLFDDGKFVHLSLKDFELLLKLLLEDDLVGSDHPLVDVNRRR